MKQILFIFYFIGTLFTNQSACSTNEEYSYKLPPNFRVINTLEENGVFGVVDTYGNGVDIYIESVDDFNVDMDLEICLEKRDWKGSIKEERQLPDSGYLARVNNKSGIYPVDTIVIIPKSGFLVKANFLKRGDPQTHAAFENKVMQLLRSIARGGSHEKAWIRCVRSFANAVGLTRSEG